MHALRDTVCAIAQPASATLGHVAAATVGAAARPKRVRMGRLCARALFRASPFRETPEARLAEAAVGQAIVGARAPGYRLEAVRFLRGAALGWLALFGLERSYALERRCYCSRTTHYWFEIASPQPLDVSHPILDVFLTQKTITVKGAKKFLS